MLEFIRGPGDDGGSLTGTISFNQCSGVAGQGREHFQKLLIAAGLCHLLQDAVITGRQS